MKRALIIVDPQLDFITGTLPVGGASEAMDRLAKALPKIAADQVFVTMDTHPIKHCSFEPNGGIWPMHCVKYSTGAAIWEPLMEALIALPCPISFIEKGCDLDRDQYSAFEDSYPKELESAEEILLCGLAGNVCVLNSLKDLVRHGLASKITVLTDASPSLDDGTALDDIIRETKVKSVTLENLDK